MVILERELKELSGIDFLQQSATKPVLEMYHILLMEELRNAVANDFEVSDYFLTFNAVGNIIYMKGGILSNIQGAASYFGNISQRISNPELADQLIAILGQQTLQTDHNLAEAIRELSVSIESERQSKVGKVISELGRCLQHGANVTMVVQAIGFLAQVVR
jgi:hypothetical protein